jgi:hypothetical protein
MTRVELDAAWTRYMHRNDLTADLDQTMALTEDRIRGRLMFKTVDLPAILDTDGGIYLHGGLIELADMVQDTEQMQKEEGLFQQAIQDYSFRHSITTSAGHMIPPLFQEPY